MSKDCKLIMQTDQCCKCWIIITEPHICNEKYSDVTDFNQDLQRLVATCQRHTRCSPLYCLKTKNG